MAKWRNEKGFTAGELLVAIAIIGLVLAAVLSIHQGALQAYMFDSTSAETQQNARISLYRMARDIREASAVTIGQASTITFTAQDGVTLVTYALNGGALQRTEGTNPAEVIVGGVEVLTLAYWDSGGNSLTVPVGTPANTRRVDITIRTRTEDVVPTGSAIKSEITTSVRLRNAP